MTQPRPETRPPIRQANDHLAEAHRLAKEAGDTRLIEKIDKAWKLAEQLSLDAEEALAQAEEAA